MIHRQRLFFLGTVLFCFIVIYPIILPLAVGLILAYLCESPSAFLERRLRITTERGKWFIAFGLVSAVQLIFVVPVILLSWTAFQELLGFWQGMNDDGTAFVQGQRILQDLEGILKPYLEWVGIKFDWQQVRSSIKDFLQPALQSLARWLGGLLSSTPQVVLFSTLSWASWIYFLVRGADYRSTILPKILPFPEERLVLARTLGDVLKAMVMTSIVLSLVQSSLVLISLGIAGIPKFYLWGALSFFLSFVPVLGTAPIMLSAAAYAYTHDQWWGAAFLVGMSLLIGLSDNIVRPWLMKGDSNLGFFWIFIALIGGLAMFGLPGAILGPWSFMLFGAALARLDQTPDAS